MRRSRVTLATIDAAATVAQRASPSTRFFCGQASAGSLPKSVITSSGTGGLLGGLGGGGRNDVDPLLAQARGLAGERAEVVELAAPHAAVPDHLHALDARRVQREGTLDADAVGDAADGERGARALSALADDGAVEDLRALLLALDDLHVHADLVAGLETLAILLELRRLN